MAGAVMNEDQQQALASLKHDQSSLQGQIKSLEEQRRLFERLGYSRYYLDMQLQALKGELAICEYRLRLVQKGIEASSRAARQQVRAESPQPEVTTRYLLPVIGAFIVSILALSAAGLLWAQRFGQDTPVSTPTAVVVLASATSAPTPTLSPPTPTPVTTVYAAIKTDGLNVRRSGSATAPVLGILSKGQVVQLAGDQVDADGRQWYRITDNGWVAGDHVQIFPTKAEAEAFVDTME